MHSQCVITSIFDEFHPMVTLKQNQVLRNQNLLDVSPPRIILLTKHVSFVGRQIFKVSPQASHASYTFRAFIVGHICITKNTGSFTRRGIYPYLLLPDTSFHALRTVELRRTSFKVSVPLINHQGWCVMAPCTYTDECDASVHM